MDYSLRLPNEMVTRAFHYLSQPDVLRVARVCSRWRSVARKVPGFYAHLILDGDHFNKLPAYEQRIETFTRQLRDAASAGFRLSLVISVQWDADEQLDTDYSSDEEYHHDAYDLDEIMPKLVREAVIRVLPQYLPRIVKLHVAFPAACFDDLQQSLLYPAPELSSLGLDFVGSGEIGEDEVLSSLSVDLFNGHTPKLTSLKLANVPLVEGLVIPALSRVPTLYLEYYADMDIPVIASHFPAVRHLSLDDITHVVKDHENIRPPPWSSLETLVLTVTVLRHGLPVMLRALITGQRIPNVYARLLSADCADIGIAVPSFLKHFQSSIHLSLFELDRVEAESYPLPLSIPRDRDTYLMELHTVTTTNRLTLLADVNESPSAIARVATLLWEHITDLRFAYSGKELVLDTFVSLPHLTTLHVILDIRVNGYNIGDSEDGQLVVHCPHLDRIVVYAP
ncbi:hypothetical protein EXIGLDRAFT_748220, partial [Exidia glandulosa HHB12029]